MNEISGLFRFLQRDRAKNVLQIHNICNNNYSSSQKFISQEQPMSEEEEAGTGWEWLW